MGTESLHPQSPLAVLLLSLFITITSYVSRLARRATQCIISFSRQPLGETAVLSTSHLRTLRFRQVKSPAGSRQGCQDCCVGCALHKDVTSQGCHSHGGR